MISDVKITHLGCAGHLSFSDKCRWHRHTQVGDKYRVSTIGDYFADGERSTVGVGDNAFFETMVFETAPRPADPDEQCGCLKVRHWIGVCARHYATRGEASAGHDALVQQYAEKLAVEGEQ